MNEANSSTDIPHSNSRDYQMLYVKLSKFEIGQVEVEPLRGTTFSGKSCEAKPCRFGWLTSWTSMSFKILKYPNKFVVCELELQDR